MKNLEEMTIEELEKAIKDKKEYMDKQEIADDFYYTNGRRKSDELELSAYYQVLRCKKRSLK